LSLFGEVGGGVSGRMICAALVFVSGLQGEPGAPRAVRRPPDLALHAA
jgi:hypothetical protein